MPPLRSNSIKDDLNNFSGHLGMDRRSQSSFGDYANESGKTNIPTGYGFLTRPSRLGPAGKRSENRSMNSSVLTLIPK